MKRMIVLLISLFFFVSVFASGKDIYPFSSKPQQRQFYHLLTELRCLVCQNENLQDSNAKLAKDLRGEVYRLVQQNKSDAEIKQYLTQRYGDFVLFKPPLKQATYVLWFMPFLLLCFALLILFFVIRLRHRSEVSA